MLLRRNLVVILLEKPKSRSTVYDIIAEPVKEGAKKSQWMSVFHMSNKTQCRTLICNLASALVTSSNRAIEQGEAFDGSQNLIQLKIWCNLKFGVEGTF